MDRLEDVLATLFHDADTAHMVLVRAGFPRARMPVFSTPMVFWSRVAHDVRNGVIAGGEKALLDEASKMYPANLALKRLRGAHAGDAPQPGHSTTDRPHASSEREGRGLSPQWIARVYEAGIDADLSSHREALLGRLPPKVRAALPATGSAAASTILMVDLNKLNQIAEKDDPSALSRWLDAASLLAAPFRKAVAVFTDAKGLVDIDERSSFSATDQEANKKRADKARLSKFLMEAFSASELQRLITELDESVTNDIAWGGAMADITFAITQVLERRNLLGDAFYDLLVRERPLRTEEILALRR